MGSFSAGRRVANNNGDRKGVGASRSCFLHVLTQPLPQNAGTEERAESLKRIFLDGFWFSFLMLLPFLFSSV